MTFGPMASSHTEVADQTAYEINCTLVRVMWIKGPGTRKHESLTVHKENLSRAFAFE
jgi:hypothetical protein